MVLEIREGPDWKRGLRRKESKMTPVLKVKRPCAMHTYHNGQEHHENHHDHEEHDDGEDQDHQDPTPTTTKPVTIGATTRTTAATEAARTTAATKAARTAKTTSGTTLNMVPSMAGLRGSREHYTMNRASPEEGA